MDDQFGIFFDVDDVYSKPKTGSMRLHINTKPIQQSGIVAT